MNKKIILPIALIALLGLVVFVSALTSTDEIETTAKGMKYLVTFDNLQPGWNLITTFDDLGAIKGYKGYGNAVSPEQIKAIYVYSNLDNKYLMVYPKKDREYLDYLRDFGIPPSSSMWIYVEARGGITYESSYIQDFSKYLQRGWNFLTITKEWKGYTLKQIEGNCNIEKVYIYIEEDSQWANLEAYYNDPRLLSGTDSQGKGLVIKVSSTCQLSKPTNSEDIKPPQVPE